ncbi:hypothetical protein O3M35_010386 [Rhynocoris fuscipes]|uniref:Uncharacterized protein n=1 Tax=Rhynocoris fuscipes TaxID=488301 RepID=A0AAW1CYP6_9HEMI
MFLIFSERKRAANWLKFLKQHENEALAVHYLLVLMLALNRKKLVRPFNIQPPENIEPLGKLKLRGMCRFILEQYKTLPQHFERNNAIKVTYSDDYKQYSCVQSLGDKGIQCYCAFSNEPVSCWDNFRNLKEYSINQCADYAANKMSLIDHKINESILNQSDSRPENFLKYLLDMKKFKVPFIGRFHVKGVESCKQDPSD